MQRSKRLHLICAGGFIGLSLAALLLGKNIPPGTISNPGPGFFPFWLALILLFLCGGLFYNLIRSRGTEIVAEAEGPSAKDILLVMTSLYGYVILMDFIGFELATWGLMFFLLRFFGSKIKTILLISLLASGLTAFLFGFLLRVPLPLKFFPLH